MFTSRSDIPCMSERVQGSCRRQTDVIFLVDNELYDAEQTLVLDDLTWRLIASQIAANLSEVCR